MKLVWTSGIRTLPGDGRPLAAHLLPVLKKW